MILPNAILLIIALISHAVGLSVNISTLQRRQEPDSLTIGFRTVSQAELEQIRGAGTLIQSYNSESMHLGRGVYISNQPYQYERHGTESTIVIKAKKTAFLKTPRVWIPKEYWIWRFEKPDILLEREDQIATQQLMQYIEDHGQDPTQTIRLGKVHAGDDYIEQMLIPNEMLNHDQNGVFIETRNSLDIRVEEPGETILFDVSYTSEGTIGSKVYTKETFQARITSLVEKASKAATEAGQQLGSDSPAAAEIVANAVATAKRCAEGVGHLYRQRPEWFEPEAFYSAYDPYANSRKIEVEFRKSRLVREVEAQQRRVAMAAGKVNDPVNQASWIVEVQQAAEESKRLLETAEAEAEEFRKAYEKVDQILKVLNGGEDEEHIRVLVENDRAVWAKLQETFTEMSGHKEPSLDVAITDEATVAQQEYFIFQEGVEKAKATVGEIEKTIEALYATDNTEEANIEVEEQPSVQKDWSVKSDGSLDNDSLHIVSTIGQSKDNDAIQVAGQKEGHVQSLPEAQPKPLAALEPLLNSLDTAQVQSGPARIPGQLGPSDPQRIPLDKAKVPTSPSQLGSGEPLLGPLGEAKVQSGPARTPGQPGPNDHLLSLLDDLDVPTHTPGEHDGPAKSRKRLPKLCLKRDTSCVFPKDSPLSDDAVVRKVSSGDNKGAIKPATNSAREHGIKPGTSSTMNNKHPLEKVPKEKQDLLAIAKRHSKEEFDSLLVRFGHDSVARHIDKIHPELSGRLQEFAELSRFERIQRFADKGATGALVAGGLALYGYSVAEAFSSDASVLDKAAVVTSILPVIGCSIHAAASSQRGNLDAADVASCFVEDALILAGFWEIALVLQVGQAAFETIEAIDAKVRLYDSRVFVKKRREGWEDEARAIIKVIDSDEFMKNVTTRFWSYQVGLIFQASQLAGDLYASQQVAIAQSNAAAEEQVANISLVVQQQLEQQLCLQTAQNKHRVQRDLEAQVLKHVQELVRLYDDDFIKDYFEKATKPIWFLGLIRIDPADDEDAKELRKGMNWQRTYDPLPMHEEEIQAAIQRTIDRLETPSPCKCLHQGRICEFLHCSAPRAHPGQVDAGGRTFFAEILSAKREGISEDCQAQFIPCFDVGQQGDLIEAINISPKQMWCRPSPEVEFCLQDRVHPPCNKIGAPRNQCVNMPPYWDEGVSSLLPDKAAGACSFYGT